MLKPKKKPLTRRLFLLGIMSFGALFPPRAAKPTANKTNDDELVIAGGWILKKSDLL